MASPAATATATASASAPSKPAPIISAASLRRRLAPGVRVTTMLAPVVDRIGVTREVLALRSKDVILAEPAARDGRSYLDLPKASELRWRDRRPQLRVLVESPLYIRFGEPPASGRSRNHANGEMESGLSCYTARYDPVSERMGFEDEGTLPDSLLAALITGQRVLLVTGTPNGRGSDGEPCLEPGSVRVLSDLTPGPDGYEIQDVPHVLASLGVEQPQPAGAA